MKKSEKKIIENLKIDASKGLDLSLLYLFVMSMDKLTKKDIKQESVIQIRNNKLFNTTYYAFEPLYKTF